jgi:hypothetical protein
VKRALVLLLASCGLSKTLPIAEQKPEVDAAPPPDATPDALPAVACMARYGALEGYELCGTMGLTCRFYVQTRGMSCEAVCLAAGGTCESSYDGNCQTTPEIRECTRTLSDQVCVCTY